MIRIRFSSDYIVHDRIHSTGSQESAARACSHQDCFFVMSDSKFTCPGSYPFLMMSSPPLTELQVSGNRLRSDPWSIASAMCWLFHCWSWSDTAPFSPKEQGKFSILALIFSQRIQGQGARIKTIRSEREFSAGWSFYSQLPLKRRIRRPCSWLGWTGFMARSKVQGARTKRRKIRRQTGL